MRSPAGIAAIIATHFGYAAIFAMAAASTAAGGVIVATCLQRQGATQTAN